MMGLTHGKRIGHLEQELKRQQEELKCILEALKNLAETEKARKGEMETMRSMFREMRSDHQKVQFAVVKVSAMYGDLDKLKDFKHAKILDTKMDELWERMDTLEETYSDADRGASKLLANAMAKLTIVIEDELT